MGSTSPVVRSACIYRTFNSDRSHNLPSGDLFALQATLNQAPLRENPSNTNVALSPRAVLLDLIDEVLAIIASNKDTEEDEEAK